MHAANRRWIFLRAPDGALTSGHFELREEGVPLPRPGEALVSTLGFSVDPAQRTWMAFGTYRPKLQPGSVMAAYGVGEVVASQTPELAVGDIVEGDLGWQDFAVVTPGKVKLRPRGVPLEHLLGTLYITGLTAYFGLFDIGVPRPGETVVVSAAAGGVGSIAVQLARLAGCRVVGVAGGPQKCAWLKGELGVHETVDYKAGDVQRALIRACPDGIDVYFDNTAGSVLKAALAVMNEGARVVCCGAVAQYDQHGAPASIPAIPAVLITKRIQMRGFVVFDCYSRREQAETVLRRLMKDGRLKSPTTVVEGLEHAPDALIRLLSGDNIGKMIVKTGRLLATGAIPT
jgi:NADPH-dependent curcumin reductase CurA